MIVSELIEQLRKFPSDTEVVCVGGGSCDGEPVPVWGPEEATAFEWNYHQDRFAGSFLEKGMDISEYRDARNVRKVVVVR